MQFDIKIFWMMPMLICPLYWNLVGMCVQLFTALNEQPAMTCLLIFPKMAFPVLVVKCSFLLLFPRPGNFCSWQVSNNIIICSFFNPGAFSAYHAGLNNKLRSSVLDDWISSKIQVVVATVAFGYDWLHNSFLSLPSLFCVTSWIVSIVVHSQFFNKQI